MALIELPPAKHLALFEPARKSVELCLGRCRVRPEMKRVFEDLCIPGGNVNQGIVIPLADLKEEDCPSALALVG